MEGRIYRLRKKSRVNYFNPATYEDAGKLIELVKQYDGLVNTVEVITSKPTDLESVILDVLEFNGFSVKKVITEKNKLKFCIPGSVENRSKAKSLVVNMKNDSIQTVDFTNYSYPVGTSKKGVMVPLVGYTKEQADNGDKGKTYISSSSTEDTSTIEEQSSPNWYLIGGAAVIGIIMILAIIKLAKK